MLLVIDIGNTNTVIGIFDDGGQLVRDWRIRTEKDTTEDELSVLVASLFSGAGIAFGDITKTVISSVVPPVERIYEVFCRKYLTCMPKWVDATTESGITIRYANPSEVGADRIVNAAAAYDKYRTNMIVVDFGTAITFDLISDKGEYTGGVIAPGIGIAAEALSMHAAKLPRIDLLNAPYTLIGHDTASSIKSGMIFGFAGLVDGIVNRIQQTAPAPYKVIATGGLASLIADISETIEAVEPNLTLEGLRIIGTN
ncbi:MAG: type III pantothenate kinase [Thermodesulfobacteriota bacterium]|nr:type III pantothenate kinase [Thermodesulfobacteriota bacterium]